MCKTSTLKVIGVISAYYAPVKHQHKQRHRSKAVTYVVYERLSGVRQSFRTCNSNASFAKEGPSGSAI